MLFVVQSKRATLREASLTEDVLFPAIVSFPQLSGDLGFLIDVVDGFRVRVGEVVEREEKALVVRE